MDYPIPQNSVKAFRGLTTSAKRNPGLIFDRFAPDTQEKDSDGGKKDTPKKLGLIDVQVAATKADEELLKFWKKRWIEMVKQDHADSPPDNPFSMTTDWRFITGLGRKGPFEVGFTFNRYGFPILPGSSVKGIAHAAALAKLAEALETDQLNALNECLGLEKDADFKTAFENYHKASECLETAEHFRIIFGTTASAGRAVFFDAIPDGENLPKLDLDIMNPHYPKYYEDKKNEVYPTDWQNPVPVYFLTVSPGTTFWFAVGWRGTLNLESQALQNDAKDWLRAGLEELGAGAKTSAGYGYFAK
jgi:CRISPR-associated protein Cmr6